MSKSGLFGGSLETTTSGDATVAFVTVSTFPNAIGFFIIRMLRDLNALAEFGLTTTAADTCELSALFALLL